MDGETLGKLDILGSNDPVGVGFWDLVMVGSFVGILVGLKVGERVG
jgi:hypothetical protein